VFFFYVKPTLCWVGFIFHVFMTTIVYTYTNVWLVWHQILIEADANRSLPTLDIIWLPDTAVKESRERIRMTLKNCDIQLPPKKIVINLAPSNVRKQWTRYDLPMAVAILALVYDIPDKKRELMSNMLFFWELWLDGSVKEVLGLLPSILSAYKKWWKHIVVPASQVKQFSCIPDLKIYPITNFLQVVDYITKDISLPCVSTWQKMSISNSSVKHTISSNFSAVIWHELLKRALTIAAAGMHNVLLVWPPWSWKTMLAKALRSILPPLPFTWVLEVSQLYSLVGKLWKWLHDIRPYRTVHHTASKVSIVWGGKLLSPWEISLAHQWVLFFDELAEFPREVLEVLRQPLEDKIITISRAQWSVAYPASFMFVATMNPCKCWFYMDREKSCSCSLHEVKRYQSKISGPLLDRFDMIVEVPRISLDKILNSESAVLPSVSSEEMYKDVLWARWKQSQRYKKLDLSLNAHLSAQDLDVYAPLTPEIHSFVQKSIENLHLSPRAIHRVVRLSRTIADLAWSENICKTHIAEALQYRTRHVFKHF